MISERFKTSRKIILCAIQSVTAQVLTMMLKQVFHRMTKFFNVSQTKNSGLTFQGMKNTF